MLYLVISEHLSLGNVLRTWVQADTWICGGVTMELTWCSREMMETILGSMGPAQSENAQIFPSRKD